MSCWNAIPPAGIIQGHKVNDDVKYVDWKCLTPSEMGIIEKNTVPLILIYKDQKLQVR